jgi:REP element-mobilizing transposase RayT
MRGLAAFGGLEILTYSFMSNHFHILVHVPEPREVSDEELLKRLSFILQPHEVSPIALQLQDYRRQGLNQAAETLKARFTYRMYNISEFFKAFKQRFSQSYNVRTGRNGPLWEQRFKSILVEGSEHALLTMAAYIDLNPVRAGLVSDPKDYRFSGYGEAVAGSKVARDGLRRLMQATGIGRHSWGQAQRAYRQRLYVQGRQKGLDPEGRPLRQGFAPEQVQKVLETGGRLPMHELLRCRVRYFSDGLALGSKAFLEEVFQRYRGHFGPRRLCGARPMRFGDWGGLCTLRDLRLQPVSRG